MRYATEEERLFAHAERSVDGCWNWTGSKAKGYGKLRVRRRTVAAHRFAYELLVGPIPDGLVIDHLCRNRACVNPAHMEPVTQRENVARGMAGTTTGAANAKTHCIRGHAFDEANTLITPVGSRVCRSCRRDREKATRRRLALSRSSA